MFYRYYNDGRVPAIWTAAPRYLVWGQFVVLTVPRRQFLLDAGTGAIQQIRRRQRHSNGHSPLKVLFP